ncbi:MAG TPA: pseudouridine synthase, partial [Rhodocyclaceae bacterium]|nr:pseudouridine synthase [Rhodocyclaceae bacterium]
MDYRPPYTPLEILHVDDALLVLNKPSGLLSVPGRGEGKQDCLASRVQALYPEALTVHRLDMSTSGLIVIARPLTFSLVAPLAGLVTIKVGERTTGVAGAFGVVASMVCWALVDAGTAIWFVV